MEKYARICYNIKKAMQNGEIMKDRLCLIPYRDVILDKTYTNIGEYFLREDSVKSFLKASGSEFENGSDFELLAEFVRICKEKSLYESALSKRFANVVKKLIGEEKVFFMPPEEIWSRTSKALLEEKNKLRAAIAASGLESVGVSISPSEEFDAHFAQCGKVDISPVLCPFGTNTVSLDTVKTEKELREIGRTFDGNISRYDSIALFFNDFSFEIPNEYSASKAYEKHLLGQSLSYKEIDVLKSQLIRMAVISASESQKEIMIFLPLAPYVRSMGEVSAFIDYIDESNIKANVTFYAGDAVSLCMTQSMTGKCYKNIIAATGVSGNGNVDIQKEILTYWGVGETLSFKQASLCKTAAGFIK